MGIVSETSWPWGVWFGPNKVLKPGDMAVEFHPDRVVYMGDIEKGAPFLADFKCSKVYLNPSDYEEWMRHRTVVAKENG